MSTDAPVKTDRVAGRRRLRFESFDEVCAEARRLHASQYRTLGNLSLGQALGHLGNGMIASTKGADLDFRLPWWVRLIGRLYYKRIMVKHRFPPGFKLPRRAREALIPNAMSFDEGYRRLTDGIDKLRTESRRHPHPLVGSLTRDEWDQFHLRHAELHLSFFVPADKSTSEAAPSDSSASTSR